MSVKRLSVCRNALYTSETFACVIAKNTVREGSTVKASHSRFLFYKVAANVEIVNRKERCIEKFKVSDEKKNM